MGLRYRRGSLCDHYGRSCNTAKQQEYYRRVGDAAAAAYANAAAIECYERLLAILPAAARGPFLVALAAVLNRSGDWPAAAVRYEEAWAGAAAGGDDRTLAAAQRGLGKVCRSQGAYTAAAAWLEQARAGVTARGDRAQESAVLRELGLIAAYQGEYERARRLYEDSLRLGRDQGDTTGVALVLSFLGDRHYR